MKPFTIPLAGMLAAGALVVADLCPMLRVVEASLVLELSQTGWGGAGRLWIAAGLMIVATILWAIDARRWPAFLSGAAFGMLLDIGFSAWQWRAEQYARVKAVGLAGFEPTIKWAPGSIALAAAFVLVFIFFVKSAFPARPPAARRAQNAREVAVPVAIPTPEPAKETPSAAGTPSAAETAFWRSSL